MNIEVMGAGGAGNELGDDGDERREENECWAARPSPAYSNSYRAPQPDYSRGYSNRSYENYGNMLARNERSGGFRPFSGGQPKSYSSQRAPSYSYKAPKNFGGGHQNFGGGHISTP